MSSTCLAGRISCFSSEALEQVCELYNAIRTVLRLGGKAEETVLSVGGGTTCILQGRCCAPPSFPPSPLSQVPTPGYDSVPPGEALEIAYFLVEMLVIM